jgi:hypothetical protein
VERVVQHTEGVGRDGVKVIGKAGSMQRGEHPCPQREVPRITEIVGDVGGGELAAGEKVAVEIAAVDVAQVDEVELVHLTTVHGQYRRGETVVDIVGIAVGGAAHRDNLSGGKGAFFCAVGGVKRAEHVVVSAVFFNDEDDMIDFLDAGQHLLGPSGWDRCQPQENANSGAKTREPHGITPEVVAVADAMVLRGVTEVKMVIQAPAASTAD